MTRLELLRTKRNEILSLAAKYGVRNIRIFGSVARGEERSDSDVDLLVDIDPDRSLLDLVGAYQDLEKNLHFHVDMVTERGLKERIRGRVLTEAVAL